jgi:hypothetical protein
METFADKKIPERTQADYTTMSHSLLLNHLQTEIKKSKQKSRIHKITDYLTRRVWAWLYYYITSRFGPNYRYTTYTKEHNGIYPLGMGRVSIALTADWATDTLESLAIAKSMADHNPDYTIHLGDTYYVGAPPEIRANFTGDGSPWVRGSKGSFAILGNHEMYARGVAFFKTLLPTLGLKTADGKYDGQKAGFFCLENTYWRILGLDTGYHSIGKVPVLEMLPWFAPDCHFDAKLMSWLREQVRLDDPEDKRGILILTHHQYITAFNRQGEFIVPAEQLARLIGKTRPVIWLWGHEHKFSIFGKAQIGDGITAYGRCMGHGGMPVELEEKAFERSTTKHGYNKLVMVDTRTRVNTPGCHLGFNGYALIALDNDVLEIEYYDVNGKIIAEKWIANLQTGILKGYIDESQIKGLMPEKEKKWQDAVN